MNRPANSKQWFLVLFPLVLISVNLGALARSPANTFEVVLGVSIGLTICVVGIWFVLRRNGRRKQLLVPALHAAREAGSVAYLYMADGKTGLITVDTSRELRMFTAKGGRARQQAVADAGAYTIAPGSFAVNATMTVDGVNVWTDDGSVVDLTLLIIPETRTENEKAFRETANQALIKISSDDRTGPSA